MSAGRALILELVLVGAVALLGVSVRAELIQRHWVYAGSDSYGYLGIADELRQHHRIAFGPTPRPLEWYRRPLYPLFLIVARGDAPARPDGGAGWQRILLWQVALELLVLWPLLYVTVRRLGGSTAALIALALAALFPPGALYSLAVLTEFMAMTLAVASVAPLLWSWPVRREVRWALAGGAAALSALTRPDGVCCVVAVIPFVLSASTSRRERARAFAAYAIVYAVVFAPWPIRNFVQFRDTHLTDGMIGRHGEDIPNYRGFWDWMRTWSADERPAGYLVSCFYDSACAPSVRMLEAEGAFVAPATSEYRERAEVTMLLAERARNGVTAPLSQAFDSLARERTRAHPFRVLVELPLFRGIRSWWAAPIEPALNHIVWPPIFVRAIPYFRTCGRVLFVSTILSFIVLLVEPRMRLAALALGLPLAVRTAALGWTGFALPRYVAPGYPLCFMLCALGLVSLKRQIAARFASSTNTGIQNARS